MNDTHADASSAHTFDPYEPWTSWEQISPPRAIRDLQEV